MKRQNPEPSSGEPARTAVGETNAPSRIAEVSGRLRMLFTSDEFHHGGMTREVRMTSEALSEIASLCCPKARGAHHG